MNQEYPKDKGLAWLLEWEERADKIISTDIEEAKYDNEDNVNSHVDSERSLKEEIKDLKIKVSEYRHEKIPKIKDDLRVAKADLSLEQTRLERFNRENEEYLTKVLKLEEQERNIEEHCRILEKNCKPNEKDLRLIASAKQKLRMYRSVTGIKWDLSAPDNIVKGYIANKINNYVEPFCFDKNKDLVPKCLWNLLKQATKEDPNIGMDKDRCE